MKNIKKMRIKAVLLLLLSLVFLVLSFVKLYEVKSFSSLYYIGEKGDAAVSCEEAESFQSKAGKSGSSEYEVLFWNIEGRGIIQNERLGNLAQTKVIAACGRVNLLADTDAFIDCTDKEACIIGRKDAFDLFGGTDAAGLEVSYEGKKYRIAAVAQKTDHIFIYQCGSDYDRGFDRAVVSCDSRTKRVLIKNDFESRFNIGSYMENSFAEFVLEIVAAAAAAVLIGSFGRLLLAGEQNPKKYRAKKAIIVLITLILIIRIIDYPADMIPYSWSEFEFWTELFKTKAENISVFIRSEKTEIAVRYVRLAAESLLFGILSVITAERCRYYDRYFIKEHKQDI